MSGKDLKVIVFVCGLFLVCGCATIFNWSNRRIVRIESSQPDTKVVVRNRGRELGTLIAPFDYEIRSSTGYFRRAAYEFEFSKPGYAVYKEERKGRFSAWYWWNIVLGGAVGMALVDPLSGSMYKIDGSPIYADLKRIDAMPEDEHNSEKGKTDE